MLRCAVARARSVAASGELAVDFVWDAAVSNHDDAQNQTSSSDPITNGFMRRMGYVKIITEQQAMQSGSWKRKEAESIRLGREGS